MRKSFKENRVLSLRKKLVAQTIVSVLIVAGIGIAGLMTSTETRREEFDLNRFLEGLDLPQRAPYLASDGVFAGEANGDYFGYSVANAGDFNNDNIDDVIVGAPDAGYNHRGKVYIFFGGDIDPSTPDVTITTIAGDTDNEDFGWSVAGGGNFDGSDGDEVIVGDPRYDNGDDTDAGIIYIFTYDSETSAMALSDAIYGDEENDLMGEGAYDLLGYSVDIAGNFDNADDDDAIVGAPGFDSGQGRAYFVLGDGSGTVKQVRAESTQSDAAFGKSVSYVGKAYDGTDEDDIIIGAPDYNDGTVQSPSLTGRAYLFWGRVIGVDYLEATADSIEITGESDGDKFGESVSYAGDVDGNKDDLIVGAPGVSSSKGKAYIFKGYVDSNIDLDGASADVELVGTATGDEFGISVSTAGDYNKDNYDDVIVGAFKEDTIATGGTDAGKAHIFYGGSSMDENSDITMVGDTSTTDRYWFGYSVSNAGDFDDDGYDDVIVGAHYTASGKGYAHLYNFHDYFTNTGTEDPMLHVGEEKGYSVASGNIDGGSYSDVIVGAPHYSSGFIAIGKVYVFKGSSTGPVSSPPLMELTGESSGDYFGHSVASGNFNGDLFDDVIVGAPGYDSERGRVYIFYGGGPLLDNIADVTLDGEEYYDWFGKSVAAAETHTDPMVSYDDAIVGAPYYDDGQDTDIGKVYVFEGSHSMDSGVDQMKLGEAAGDNFGNSVSNAGDVNGGAEDVIVGALAADDPSKTDCGKAYIYAGSATGLSGSSIGDLVGESGSDWFGYSVSTAGDYDGDGYDDVIVGAIQYALGGNGKAYIYLGASGSTFDENADYTFAGEGSYDAFGNSVSTAGDVNNDGYDDVVVGAEYNDAGGQNAGRVYVYYGASTADAREDVYMTGQSVSEQLGSSVACAGDVNDDDYDDIVTGASSWDSNKGSVKVWGDPS